MNVLVIFVWSVCAPTFVCFQAGTLWLTTGSSNQQYGMATTFPFPWWPPPLHLPPSTIEIPGSHYWLWGLRVNPIFQLSLSPFSPYRFFPRGCRLLSPKFTSVHAWQRSGIHRKPSITSPTPPPCPRPHSYFSVPLTDSPLISGSTHTKDWTWLKTC